ncbi:MAG: hypothetical protein HY608_08170 [Planctomycetes bacterium]|nr:hypothetical protein [Planctomycetota bacterium]
MLRTLLSGGRADTRGQALVFAAFTMLVLVAFVAFATRAVETLALKIELSGAADASAYSAAVVIANALQTIAAINHLMIWCYRGILGIVVGVVTLGVLAAISVVLPAFAWAVPAFQKALKVARRWIPRLTRWARKLSQAERGIARAAPYLAQAEAIRIARANGATLAVAWPPPTAGVVAEPNRARFLDIVGMGIPRWAVGRVFPAHRMEPGGEEELVISESGDVDLGRGRDGRTRRETRSATRSSRDLGDAPISRAGKKDLAEFDRMMGRLGRERLPLPLVWTRAGIRREIVVGAWLSPASVEERRGGTFGATGLPSAYPGMVAVAAARPWNPDLEQETIGTDPDNLFVTEGWRARLVPVPHNLTMLWNRFLPGAPPQGTSGWLQH